MNKVSAVIQGAFLSANRISPLSSLRKTEWDKVGHSVLKTLEEISRQKDVNTDNMKKTLVCAVWLKLLNNEAGEDIEVTWRESQFFFLQNGLPELNRDVLLELIRSTASIDIYTRLLLCFTPSQFYRELEKLVQHISSSPIRQEDVNFFLDIWWELWRCSDLQKDSTEEMFAKEVVSLSSKSKMLQQPAKRLKLDPSDLPNPATDVLYILLDALRNLRDHLTTTELAFRALSISLDALYTSFLIDGNTMLSTKDKLQILSQISTIREKHDKKLSPKMIEDSLRDLRASDVPSQFKPLKMKLEVALTIITDLLEFWFSGGLLKVEDKSNPSYFAFKSKLSLQNVIAALNKADRNTDHNNLKMLLDTLDFSDADVTTEVNAKITMTVISHQMDDYQNFALLFAGEQSWMTCDKNWIDFLEKNQSAFRQQDTLIQLASNLVSKFKSVSMDVSQYRKLMKVCADIFSALSFDDKNKTLAAMLGISRTGFFGSNVSSTVSTSFEQELNMAFNCIIQGGTSATSNLNTAVSLVARVAFQNPEAAVKAVCNSAISNKGAFSLMAKILQELPGLSGRFYQEGETEGTRGKDLICHCVKDIIRTKQLADSEQDQLVKFLSLLMQPVAMMVEGEERRESFLSPQTVVCAFVLPNLSLKGQRNMGFGLSLQLLHNALSLDLQDRPAPHWAMLCSPFPLLYVLAQLHNHTLRRWEQPKEDSSVPVLSMETQELLVTVLSALGQVVAAEMTADPDSWSRAVFWLYNKTEKLDWTVRFLLKPVWGKHFKNEVPASLLDVCDLPEHEWTGLDLPQYGSGTGLLAWTECCFISDALQSTMLSCLSLDQSQADHVNMFSKGMLVALTQTLPCCSLSQWSRLLMTLKTLLKSGRLHVPFSLEYIDYLPLLDLRRFASELRLSVLLLRVFQLLCGSSCSHWLSQEGWGHIGTLYAHAIRDIIGALKTKLPLNPKTTVPNQSSTPVAADKEANLNGGDKTMEEVERVPSQEVLFVLSQIYCHVQHVQVMMPGGQSEQLFLCSLEVLSQYEAVMGAHPESSSALESHNTRHFFSTITDNLQNQEMKAVLQHKISQLVSSAA